MTAYLLTPEQHAQIVDALEQARKTAMANVMAARIPECADFAGIAQNLDWVVAMLKAMKPVEPVAIVAKDGFAQIQIGWRKVVQHNTELYAQAEGGV